MRSPAFAGGERAQFEPWLSLWLVPMHAPVSTQASADLFLAGIHYRFDQQRAGTGASAMATDNPSGTLLGARHGTIRRGRRPLEASFHHRLCPSATVARTVVWLSRLKSSATS